MLNLARFLVAVAVAFFATVFARSARGIGRQVSVTRLTNVASVTATIDRQIHVFGKVGTVAILAVVLVAALTLFTPSGSGAWAPILGSIVGFVGNIALGFATGVGSNVSDILAKPGIRDTIDATIDMIQRTRRHLSRFVSIILLALLAAAVFAGQAMAADGFIVWAIDITDSVDPAQRAAGIETLIDSALDVAHALGADRIEIVKFSDQDMLSESEWVRVPPAPRSEDCQKAKPAFQVTEGWISFSPQLAIDRKDEAVRACVRDQAARRGASESDIQRFHEQLRRAVRATPIAEGTTRIVPIVKYLVALPGLRGLFLLSDCLDHSGVPVASVTVPDAVPLTVIVARLNPRRHDSTAREVIAAAGAWKALHGVAVTTVAESRGTHFYLAELRP